MNPFEDVRDEGAAWGDVFGRRRDTNRGPRGLNCRPQGGLDTRGSPKGLLLFRAYLEMRFEDGIWRENMSAWQADGRDKSQDGL